MKKLKSLKIFGVKYKVTVDTLNGNVVGLCDKATKRLFVEECVADKDEAMKILVHEIHHALLHESNLDQVVSPEVEELLCLMSEKIVDLLDVKIK